MIEELHKSIRDEDVCGIGIDESATLVKKSPVNYNGLPPSLGISSNSSLFMMNTNNRCCDQSWDLGQLAAMEASSLGERDVRESTELR